MRPPIERFAMSTNMKIAVGIHITKTISTEIYTKKLLKRYREVRNIAEAYEADLVYLCDVLNRNEIELDEFDLIALNNIQKKSS
jgi:hypothetical protein